MLIDKQKQGQHQRERERDTDRQTESCWCCHRFSRLSVGAAEKRDQT